MPSQEQSSTSLFRTIVLAGITALLITSAALPIAAQNSVPATAMQAARSPEFARRLAHPAPHPATRPKPALARQGSRSGPGGGNDVYENGPINGTTDAWTINFGFVVSDTFTVGGSNPPTTGMSFGAWLFAGDTLVSAEVSITSQENGGIVYFDQTVIFTQSACVPNQYGYNVCTETNSFNGPMLQEGTYWVNLQNALVSSGDPVFWDENSGAGCHSSGCPSEASQNDVGTIPSESFSMLGNNCIPAPEKPAVAKAVPATPSPTQSYRVIYNFTGAGDGASPSTGLVIDAAGNLYGTTGAGGLAGGGTVFKLAPAASGWRYSRLYSFTGANGAGPDSTLVIGPDGRLYGTTNVGGTGDGVLFGLSPAGNILPSVFSNWIETLLYSFTGGSDGANPGGSLVLDSSGNIYGNAAMAGANHGGTLYEFSNGSIQVLHAFPAFSGDGSNPAGVVSTSNGLYGITANGGAGRSGTLYTTAGGYQVLHSFTSDPPEGNPVTLAADQAGNLYGSSAYTFCFGAGASVFQLSAPDWDPLILANFVTSPGISSWVSSDASGNVYGTTNITGDHGVGNVFELTCCWNFTNLHDFAGGPNDGAFPMAPPVADAQGNIYGTTSSGGTYGQGVVWEVSP